MKAEKTHPKPPLASQVTGFLLGGVTAGTAALLLTDDANWGSVYLAAAVGMFVLAPLLLVNLVMSVLYLRRGTPGQVLAWIWLPVILVLSVVLLMYGLSEHARGVSEAKHPSVRELHVNLSGRSIWFDPAGSGADLRGRVDMPGDAPGVFAAFTRYHGDEDPMAIYDGARLAESFQSMAVLLESPPNGQPRVLPVIWQAEAFPDVESFMRLLSFRVNEASVTEHWFFHYPDRVEVAPALALAGSQAMDLRGSSAHVVAFHIANLSHQGLARLEVDGATLALGSEALAPEQAQVHGCRRRNHMAHAINHLLAPLKVRWQWAQANPAWHETTVEVPAFRPQAQRLRGRARLTSIDLYIQADGQVVAERSVLRDLPSGAMSIHTTGPSRPLTTTPPCGFAPDRYTEQVNMIRD